jgi:hypothetical protein
MGVRCFTRQTHALSARFENDCHLAAIYPADYNFGRVSLDFRAFALACRLWHDDRK